jgi:hypothetical protein
MRYKFNLTVSIDETPHMFEFEEDFAKKIEITKSATAATLPGISNGQCVLFMKVNENGAEDPALAPNMVGLPAATLESLININDFSVTCTSLVAASGIGSLSIGGTVLFDATVWGN